MFVLQLDLHNDNSLSVDTSPYSDTLSRLHAKQSFPLFLNAACLAEKQEIAVFSWTLPRDGTNDIFN